MNQNLDLKEIEHKLKKAANNDGFWEILVGCFIISLTMLFRFMNSKSVFLNYQIWILIPVPFIAGYLVSYWGKKIITEPRLGIVKFRSDREPAAKKIMNIIWINCDEDPDKFWREWRFGENSTEEDERYERVFFSEYNK